MSDRFIGWTVGTAFVWTVIALFGGFFWAGPQWGVYQQRMAGVAELQRAESNRKVAVLEAQAKMEAAIALAEADVHRATGIAAANKIIGQSLHENPEYLKWLWIHEVGTKNPAIIYTPTEAGLPVLEAGRRP